MPARPRTAGRSTSAPVPATGAAGWRERVAGAGVALVAASPLVLVPGALDRFTLPKLVVLALAVACAALAPAAGRLPRTVAGVVAAGAAVLVVTALAGDAPVAQLLGRWPRFEGLVALPVYVGVVWAGARLLGPGAPPGRGLLLRRASAVAALVLAAVSALEAAGLRPLGGDVARPGALLGNATDQGVLGMLLLAVLLGGIVSRGAGRDAPSLDVLGAVAAVVVVVLSGSRAALLGAALVAVVVGVRSLLVPHRGGALRAAAALGALVVGTLAVPGTRERVTGGDPVAAGTVGGRAELWGATFDLVRAHPWGRGPSGFVDALPTALRAQWWRTQDPRAAVDSPHAWPLQALVAGGVPLLLLAVGLAALVLVRVVAALRAAPDDRSPVLVGAAAGVLGYAAALLTHFPTSGTVGLAGLLAGALLAAPRGPRVPSRAARPTGLAGAAAARGVASARSSTPASTGSSGTLRAPRPGELVVAGVAGVVAVGLALGVAGDRRLDAAQAAAAAGDVAAADAHLAAAARLRPWDRDVPLLAAATFREGALAGDPASAEAARRWAGEALRRTPGSVEAGKVLLLAELALGDDAAPGTAAALAARAPSDPEVALLEGYALAVAGRWDDAAASLDRATGNPFTRDRAEALLDEVRARAAAEG